MKKNSKGMHRMPKTMLPALMGGLLVFSACTKEGVDPKEEQQNNTEDLYKTVVVLNNDAHFENIWDTVTWVPGQQVTKGKLGITDFTVDADNKLHFMWYYQRPTQQSTFYDMQRRSMDLSTRQIIPQSAQIMRNMEKVQRSVYNLYNADINLGFEQYKPYLNVYAEAFDINYSGGGFSNSYVLFRGDVASDYETKNIKYWPGLNGRLDMSFRNPVVNFNTTRSAAFNQPMFFGANTGKDIDYMATVHQTYDYYDAKFNIMYGLPEARSTGNSYYIAFFNNSVKAYKVEAVNEMPTREKPMKDAEEKASISLASPINVAKSWRHYSLDGNIMSFLVFDGNAQKYYSFVYNFTTSELKKVLDGVTLTYGDNDKSDFDLDEEGNVYYTGYAGNGSNTNGVAIYKLSAGGTNTLIGDDNLIKNGEVIKLKYLHGKIYFVVTGAKVGYPEIQQLSIIRQK